MVRNGKFGKWRLTPYFAKPGRTSLKSVIRSFVHPPETPLETLIRHGRTFQLGLLDFHLDQIRDLHRPPTPSNQVFPTRRQRDTGLSKEGGFSVDVDNRWTSP